LDLITTIKRRIRRKTGSKIKKAVIISNILYFV